MRNSSISLFFKRCKSPTSEIFLLYQITTFGPGGTRVVGTRSIMHIMQSRVAILQHLELVSGPWFSAFWEFNTHHL